jgi:hypothetical protein
MTHIEQLRPPHRSVVVEATATPSFSPPPPQRPEQLVPPDVAIRSLLQTILQEENDPLVGTFSSTSSSSSRNSHTSFLQYYRYYVQAAHTMLQLLPVVSPSVSSSPHPFVPLLQDALHRAHIAVIILAAFVDTPNDDSNNSDIEDCRNDQNVNDNHNNNHHNNNNNHANYQQAVWILRQCFRKLLALRTVEPIPSTVTTSRCSPLEKPVHDPETPVSTMLLCERPASTTTMDCAHLYHPHLEPSSSQEEEEEEYLSCRRQEAPLEDVHKIKICGELEGNHHDDDFVRDIDDDEKDLPNHDSPKDPITPMETDLPSEDDRHPWLGFIRRQRPLQQQHQRPRHASFVPWHFHCTITILPNWMIASTIGMASQLIVESILQVASGWDDRPPADGAVTNRAHLLYSSNTPHHHHTSTYRYVSKLLLESVASLFVTTWMIIGTNRYHRTNKNTLGSDDDERTSVKQHVLKQLR